VGASNLETVREAYETLSERGYEALLPLIHDEFEVTTPPELAAEPDTYRGPEGMRRYFESFYEAMDKVEFTPTAFHEVGEWVVVEATLRARGRTTGIEQEQSAAFVWHLRDEKAIRLEVYASLDEALEAARLGGGVAEESGRSASSFT
jgi:ketosteroid isomerase-like protein